MQGSSGTRGGLVYLLAGAALGAAIVTVLWMASGGRPFGDVFGGDDVRPPTPAAVAPAAPQERAGTPASAGAQLESEPPEIGRSRPLQFKKPAAAKRPAKAATAKAKTKAKKLRRAATRRKQVVRVVAPPPSETTEGEETPVAVVPSPAPTAAPAPPAPGGGPDPGGGKPAKPKAPTYTAGAGEG
jgi:hypothetical protein